MGENKKKVLPNATGTVNPILPNLDLTYNPDMPILETTPVEAVKPIDTKQKIKFNKDKSVDVNGKTLTPAEYKAYLGAQGGENTGGGQFTPQVQQLAQEQRQRELGLTPLSPEALQQQQALLNVEPRPLGEKPTSEKAIEGAFAAGGAIGGALSAGGTGAAIGSIAGPVGTIAGAIIGGIAGGLAGAFGALSLEAKQDVKEGKTNYNNAVSGLNLAQALANEGRTAEAIQVWRTQKQNLYYARDQLHEQTKNTVGKELSNAQDEYATTIDYINNWLPAEEASFLIALNNPNPAKAQLYYQTLAQATTEQ